MLLGNGYNSHPKKCLDMVYSMLRARHVLHTAGGYEV